MDTKIGSGSVSKYGNIRAKSRLYHQIVHYSRVKDIDGSEFLIPIRVSWFNDGVKFLPLHRETDFRDLFGGHCQWIADQIQPMQRAA